MSIPYEKPDLLKAQFSAFSKQIPLMYFILLSSSWGLAATHMGKAPTWLTIYCPIFLTFICLLRILNWWRAANKPLTVGAAVKTLKRTNRVAGLLALGFSTWAMALFPYGDAYTQSHVAFYMAITVVGCIFCLMHLRPAAFMVAVIVNVAFIVFFISTHNPVFIAMAINVALVSAGMLMIVLVYYRDFTRMVAAQATTLALSDENLRLANLDALTMLPNRRGFFATLDREFAKAKIGGKRLAAGIIDLDGFKPVNDLYGHSVGDTLLVEVGRRLATFASEYVYLARLGGDEFALVVAHDAGNSDLLSLGEQICDSLRAPFVLAETTVQISASVGMAVYPDLASNAAALFERADYALYYGKRSRRSHAILFSADHDAALRRNARIEQALLAANLNEELDVFFQPIVDIATGRTVGLEALARWTSPTLGQVSPGQFIPVAERAGIVSTLTRVLLEKALLAAMKWPRDIRLSFNLSANDISSPDGVLRLVSIILKSSFDARRLDLEITETAVMQDFAQARAAIDTLKALGCGISLDDFGTGYSSLSHLHALPLSKIKIDRSFVTGLHLKPASYKIVRSLLSLSRDMDLGCIVEGVETEEEMQALRTLGAPLVQGYYYSPPMAEHLVAGFLGRSNAEAKAG